MAMSTITRDIKRTDTSVEAEKSLLDDKSYSPNPPDPEEWK